MIDNLISNSRTDPTIVDIVRETGMDVKSKIESSAEQMTAALTAALINGHGTASPEVDTLLDNSLSHEYCNLFIVKNVSFDGNKNCFVISRDRALKHKSSESFEIFDDRIKSFPSLFITTNGDYRRCRNPDQRFYYGMVTGVTEQGKKNIEICFRKLFSKPMQQQHLNEIAVEIGININNGVDLLDEINWIVKQIDIRKKLTECGIAYA